MTREGWIFMVGFRIFDVGLLVVWLVWFFRLRHDADEGPEDEGGGGGGGTPPEKRPRGPGGGGLRFPLGRVPTGAGRHRDGHRSSRVPSRRRPAPAVPAPLPARVRSPGAPARVTRHSRAAPQRFTLR